MIYMLTSSIIPQMRFNLRRSFPLLTTKVCVNFGLKFVHSTVEINLLNACSFSFSIILV